jgi:hypothetical protein
MAPAWHRRTKLCCSRPFPILKDTAFLASASPGRVVSFTPIHVHMGECHDTSPHLRLLNTCIAGHPPGPANER